MVTFPTLYKKSATGSALQWKISVTSNPNKTAVITTKYGRVGGKQICNRELIKSGKNVGKVNETSAYQQAKREAKSRHTAKLTLHRYQLQLPKRSSSSNSKAPMLAYTYEDHKHTVDWDTAYVQPKLDGFRCIAIRSKTTTKLVSRNGKVITTLPHITAELTKILRPGDVLDGELYCNTCTFQQLVSYIRKTQPGSLRVKFNAFDCIPSKRNKTFANRLKYVKELNLQKLKHVSVVRTDRVKNHNALMRKHSSYVKAGFEGAILRHGNRGYEYGARTNKLLKVKAWRDAEFEIVKVREGKGKCAGMCVLICRAASGGLFEVFAPGNSEQKRKAWSNRDALIGRRITVKYFEMTTSKQPVPRFPVALRLYEENIQ